MSFFTEILTTKNRRMLGLAASVVALAMLSIAPAAFADPGDVVAEPASAEQMIEPTGLDVSTATQESDAALSPTPTSDSAATCDAESADSLDQLTTSVVEASGSCYSQGWECGVNQDPNCGGACRCRIVANGCGYCPC